MPTIPQGEQANKLLQKIYANELKSGSIKALAANPISPLNPNFSSANIKQKYYEGYSAKRKDQVELVLSALDSNLRSIKDNQERPFREIEKHFILPKIT